MTRRTDRDHDDDRIPDEWAAADDERIRSALMTLRDEVDALALSEPAVIRARHERALRIRRTVAWVGAVAATVVAVAAIAFSQLGTPEAARLDPAAPSGAAGPAPSRTPVPTASTTAGPSEPEPTETVRQTVEPCGAVIGTLDVDGVVDSAATTAGALMDAALACDSETLIRMATEDRTQLSYGIVTAAEAFAIPPAPEPENRYALLSALLTLPPRYDEVDGDGFYRWPAEPTTEAQWQELIDTGIITARDRDLMTEFDSGYVGYRVVIDRAGQWTAFLGGD